MGVWVGAVKYLVVSWVAMSTFAFQPSFYDYPSRTYYLLVVQVERRCGRWIYASTRTAGRDYSLRDGGRQPWTEIVSLCPVAEIVFLSRLPWTLFSFFFCSNFSHYRNRFTSPGDSEGMFYRYKEMSLSWNRGAPMASRRGQILLAVFLTDGAFRPMRLATVSTQGLRFVYCFTPLCWVTLAPPP